MRPSLDPASARPPSYRSPYGTPYRSLNLRLYQVAGLHFLHERRLVLLAVSAHAWGRVRGRWLLVDLSRAHKAGELLDPRAAADGAVLAPEVLAAQRAGALDRLPAAAAMDAFLLGALLHLVFTGKPFVVPGDPPPLDDGAAPPHESKAARAARLEARAAALRRRKTGVTMAELLAPEELDLPLIDKAGPPTPPPPPREKERERERERDASNHLTKQTYPALGAGAALRRGRARDARGGGSCTTLWRSSCCGAACSRSPARASRSRTSRFTSSRSRAVPALSSSRAGRAAPARARGYVTVQFNQRVGRIRCAPLPRRRPSRLRALAPTAGCARAWSRR